MSELTKKPYFHLRDAIMYVVYKDEPDAEKEYDNWKKAFPNDEVAICCWDGYRNCISFKLE